jgi:hypothetical protein
VPEASLASRPLSLVSPSPPLIPRVQHRSAADLAAPLADTVGFHDAHGVSSKHRERIVRGGCKQCGLHRAD